jgi:hypothetical protein
MDDDFPTVGYYTFAFLDEDRTVFVFVPDTPVLRQTAEELIKGWTCYHAIANEMARALSAWKPDSCDEVVFQHAAQSLGLALIMLGAPPFLLFKVKDGTVQEARHIPAKTAFEAEAYVRRMSGLPEEEPA